MARRNGGFIGTDGLDAPDPPTGVTVSGGTDGVASISFTAPTDTGTSAITGFIATSSTSVGATGTSSPISVSSLTLGTEVTFRAYAVNAYGTSAASDVTSAITPAAGLGLFAGGYAPSATNEISQITISTTGNTTDWGDLTTTTTALLGGCASTTRGVFGPGNGNKIYVYDYITFATAGNAVDFGDPTLKAGLAFLSNSTRGVGGGKSDSTNRIEYVTIASVGNATDFGDLSVVRLSISAASSTTRGIFFGGRDGGTEGPIDYVTIASTGNATDFGDPINVKAYAGGASSNTRMVSGGGHSGGTTEDSSKSDSIEYITIASTGNATDFGDLTVGRNSVAAESNSTRAVFQGGGGWGNGTTARTTLDYVTIASTGNATDFGDQASEMYGSGSVGNAHGGL